MSREKNTINISELVEIFENLDNTRENLCLKGTHYVELTQSDKRHSGINYYCTNCDKKIPNLDFFECRECNEYRICDKCCDIY